MKDRQAELEQNIVAENLANVYKTIEPYSKLILTAIVVVVIALIGFGLYTSGETAKKSDATLQLLMDNPEVASQYPNTVAASWSLMFQANDNLARGVNALYQNRDEAETLLAQAKDQFIDARGGSDDPLLISRASYGLGLVSESLGEVDEAIKAYERAVEANESEQMVEVAQSRIERLANPDTADFLTWFSEQDFAPADPSLPPELPGASALPDMPNLDLPGLDLGKEMGGSDESPRSLEGGLELPDVSSEEAKPETGSESESEASEPTEKPAGEADGGSSEAAEETDEAAEGTEDAAEASDDSGSSEEASDEAPTE